MTKNEKIDRWAHVTFFYKYEEYILYIYNDCYGRCCTMNEERDE